MRCQGHTWFLPVKSVTFLSIILTRSILAKPSSNSMFLVATGIKLSQGTQLLTESSNGVNAIYCSAMCSSGCGSATYSMKYKTCITFVEKFYNSSIVWSQDSDWAVLYREEQRVQHGDWTLVFRAQSGINIPLYNTSTAAGQHDDSTLSGGVLNGCYRLDNMSGYKQHFRNSILDNWINIKQVKLSVYVKGSEVDYIVFNGSSTTRDSWFRPSNILSSSWNSIKNDSNIHKFELSGSTMTTPASVNLFRIAAGVKFTQGTQLLLKRTNSVSAIYCSAICSSVCGSATFSFKHKTCITFVEKFYDSSIVWSQDPDWHVLYRDDHIRHGDWTMVFRAQKEVNISMYDVWAATGRHDDSPLSSGVLNGCYRLDNLGGCKQHFRSSILDNWRNIQQVKFSAFVNGSEVAYIVFDGTSTTRDSWFRQSIVLRSWWPFIKTDVSIAVFDLAGQISSSVARRFAISGPLSFCHTTRAYFLSVDKPNDTCDDTWSMKTSSYPVFIYSVNSGLAALSAQTKEYKLADVMAVFVKF